ncbi:MAG: hypothetical protein BroJett018_18850 [Chloroflexota bacterium]|nr:hypothetical protein [Chloroflexota bacterium]NOG62398.1 hypothetical protein [Chloroflexota bacterium]GIK64091.1 MAG: hypothetical protein BroJett018_18850 [Chloroflexota bacterium]
MSTTKREWKSDKGFFLTQEYIQEIYSILVKRLSLDEDILSDPSKPPLEFSIERANGSKSTLANPNEIFDEKNIKGEKLTELSIVSYGWRNKKDIDIRLTFRRNDLKFLNGTKFSVKGNDEDLVALVFNDIKTLLDEHVNIIQNINRPLKIGIICFSAILIILWILFGSSSPRKFSSDDTFEPSKQDFQEVLQTEDANQKLDFLIKLEQNQKATNETTTSFVLLCVPIVLLIAIFIAVEFTDFEGWAFVKKLYMPNVLYMGQEVDYYNQLLKNRQNLIWSIIVAFIVGVASSIFVWLLTL